jgi:DNA-binding transcriptional regulator YbjK
MALRIWCNPQCFPDERREAAVAAAAAVLAARGVTLEQAEQAYAYVERMCDLPDLENEVPDHTRGWEDAWFEAIDAAEATANIAPKRPLGAILLLDATDVRIGKH